MGQSHFYIRRIDRLKAGVSIQDRVSIVGELVDEGFRASVISRDSGLKSDHVRHCARVHKRLVNEVMELFQRDKISFSLARSIASLPVEDQERAARNAIAKKISVHLFRGLTSGSSDTRLEADLEKLANRYSEVTGLDIKIKSDAKNKTGGTWYIKYYSLDDFDTISEKVVGSQHEF